MMRHIMNMEWVGQRKSFFIDLIVSKFVQIYETTLFFT